MSAFVSVPAQLQSVSAHACTWSTFKSLYLQPLGAVSVHVRARKHLTVDVLTCTKVFACVLPCLCVCVCALSV